MFRPVTIARGATVAIIVVTLLVACNFGGLASAQPSTGGVTPSILTATLTINAAGAVSTAGILAVSGNTYTLIANYAGSILDERNGSILDGAGLMLTYTTGSYAIMASSVVGATIENFGVSSSVDGIWVGYSGDVNVTHNEILTGTSAVDVVSSDDVNVSGNDAPDTQGMLVLDSGNVTVSHNDLLGILSGGGAEYHLESGCHRHEQRTFGRCRSCHVVCRWGWRPGHRQQLARVHGRRSRVRTQPSRGFRGRGELLFGSERGVPG